MVYYTGTPYMRAPNSLKLTLEKIKNIEKILRR
jgi:hypothetical protein